MKPFAGFEAKVLTAFTAAALVVVGLMAANWTLQRNARDAAAWVDHTREVVDFIARTKTETLQIEYSTQSFRISGDPQRLVERDASIALREDALRKLRELTADNSAQQALWERLRAVINERLAISRQVELLRKTQGQDAANAFVATAPLQATRARTYGLLSEMDAAERQLLNRRSAELAQYRRTLVATGALAVAALLLLLAATYVLIRRQLRATHASQQALAASEESLSITLYSIGDAVLATDVRGLITRMNPVAEALTGWSIGAAHGRPVDEVFRILHEYTRAPAEIPVAKVLATGTVQEIANHTVLIARDGREYPISDSAAPIRGLDGTIQGVVLVFRDVEVQRNAQRLIEQQNELLEQHVQERTMQLLESESHLRSVISNVPAMIAYVDAEQRYVYANQQYHDRFVPDAGDITGRTVQEVLGEERYAVAQPRIQQALLGHPQSYDWQPFVDVWQAIEYVPMRDAQNRVQGYYVLGTDITARKRAAEEIEALNSNLKQNIRDLEHTSRALRTLSAGNRTMLRADSEQSLLDSMCQAIVEAGGYRSVAVWYKMDDADQALLPMAQQGHPGGLGALQGLRNSWKDDAKGQSAVAIATRTGRCVTIQNLQTDPGYLPWRAQLSDYVSVAAFPLRVNGAVIGCLVVYSSALDYFGAQEVNLLTESADDLAYGIATLRARAERQSIQDDLYQMARYDALTGLPNETRFTELLVEAIGGEPQSGQPFAVLHANIERMSEINDALGFGQGDHVLREFGMRLSTAAPPPAVVARLRGDEFAILLPASTAIAALTVGQRVQGLLEQPIALDDIALEVSSKIGVVVFPEHGCTPQDLYRNMDIALQQAKKRGVKQVVFDPSDNLDRARRLSMAGELRRAIEGNDLSLYLQPKVEMASGRVSGAEGLVRWHHAQRGLVLPGEFIDLAEHTGLIKPLTEWVIEAALRLIQAWGRQGLVLPIAVNLSARNLRDEALLDKIAQLQARWGVPPGLLELEITESTVMEDAERALRVLHDLRLHGMPLYIDDFGTGYSSLSYLQRLPVEAIKIDQSFVRNMAVSKDSAAIVRSTIDLAHDLGHTVVAEGVETAEDWDQLRAFDCDCAQGYFIARPMPADAFPGWLAAYRPIRS